MKNVNNFKNARIQSIKGNYEEARNLFNKCLEEESDDIMINIEVSLLDIICGNIINAKRLIMDCMEKDKNKTVSYLKTLENSGKKYSNACVGYEFVAYMNGLETLYYISN